jgi:hypothetical protein
VEERRKCDFLRSDDGEEKICGFDRGMENTLGED